ncbi:MAG: sugar ABC transporter permease [Lachnospiraceae bacterium]|nr:sugar ABC transporter permease [Lachnospiraceae bacterium]MCX4307832.1 ABC transporter permease subunit [Acetatifactor sp.]
MKNFVKQVRRNKILLLMLLPAIAYVIVFSYIPMGGIIVAFKRFSFSKGFLGSPWCGLENFRFLFISDKLWPLMRNTLLYNAAFITVGMVMEVGFAIIINELGSKWFKKVFQSFMFLPFFISWVVVIAIVDAIFGYDSGIINQVLQSLGLEKFNIYVNAAPWPFLLVFFKAWKQTGYGSIVYLAAISGMDQEIVDAAEIDGANIWQRIRYITIPSLKPTIIIMMLLAIGNIFRGDFGMFYQLIGNNSVLLEVGDILDLYIYRAMVSSSNLGMASAAGFYQSILCFFTIIAANWMVKKYDPDYSLF